MCCKRKDTEGRHLFAPERHMSFLLWWSCAVFVWLLAMQICPVKQAGRQNWDLESLKFTIRPSINVVLLLLLLLLALYSDQHSERSDSNMCCSLWIT